MLFSCFPHSTSGKYCNFRNNDIEPERITNTEETTHTLNNSYPSPSFSSFSFLHTFFLFFFLPILLAFSLSFHLSFFLPLFPLLYLFPLPFPSLLFFSSFSTSYSFNSFFIFPHFVISSSLYLSLFLPMFLSISFLICRNAVIRNFFKIVLIYFMYFILY